MDLRLSAVGLSTPRGKDIAHCAPAEGGRGRERETGVEGKGERERKKGKIKIK